MSELRTEYCDVLIVGSGAAGLAAAVTARQANMRVIVAEKAKLIGGTSVRSSGWLWIPDNPLSKRAGIEDSADDARTYLRHEAGNHYDADRVDAFLNYGPRMVEFLERKGKMRFELGHDVADCHSDVPGASMGGRSIHAAALNASEMGGDFKKLGVPINEMTFFGVMYGSSREMLHFFNATRSFKSFLIAMKLVLQYAADKLIYGRSMRLSDGAALIGRLAKTAISAGVKIWTDTNVTGLLADDERVIGAVMEREGEQIQVISGKGVILAAGGFPHDITRRAMLYPHDPSGDKHWTAAPEENIGDGLRLGVAMGGVLNDHLPHAAAWAPVSQVPKPDGTSTIFPHLGDQAKPGIIAVNPDGRRFTNEANSPHDFVQDMILGASPYPDNWAWLVCDQKALRKYGMGAVKPFPSPIMPYLDNGYLIQGNSMADLGGKISVAQTVLVDTVVRWNQQVRDGADADFRRGESAFNRSMGDPGNLPNPCLATLETPPYFAVKILPGDLGTFTGLNTDAKARVLDERGRPIVGLYAAGNDMGSIMGGSFPALGSTIGPAMTFGYIAACHMIGKDPDEWAAEEKTEEEAQ